MNITSRNGGNLPTTVETSPMSITTTTTSPTRPPRPSPWIGNPVVSFASKESPTQRRRKPPTMMPWSPPPPRRKSIAIGNVSWNSWCMDYNGRIWPHSGTKKLSTWITVGDKITGPFDVRIRNTFPSFMKPCNNWSSPHRTSPANQPPPPPKKKKPPSPKKKPPPNRS